MSTNYNAKPINAPLITKPGESLEHVGTRNVTSLLPTIFQTSVNKQFLDSTLEQLMTSGSLEAINSYVGSIETNTAPGNAYVTNNELNFVPAAINKTGDNVNNAITYKDLLNALKFNEASTKDGVLSEFGYVLNLPINYDMFINYHNYHWLVTELPACQIVATAADPIVIDNIINEVNYTTPTLANGKTLEFTNGMRIQFSPVDITRYIQSGTTATFAMGVAGTNTVKVYLNNALQVDGTDYNIVGSDVVFTTAPAVNDEVEIHCFWVSGTNYDVDDIYIVAGVGTTRGISFVKQYTASTTVKETGKLEWINQTVYSGRGSSSFDDDSSSFEGTGFDQREFKLTTRDYVVESRQCPCQSAWARSNLWIHEQDAIAICNFLDVNPSDYITEATRGIRPIIELVGNIEKYNFGNNHILNVTHILDNVDPYTIVGQTSWDLATATISTLWESKGYTKGESVKFVIGGQTSYWNCIETHSEGKNPTYYENGKYWAQVSVTNLKNDDTILFIDGAGSYNNKIYRVSGVDTSIALTEIYNTDGSSGATQLQALDKVLVTNGYNDVFGEEYPNDIYSGSEWHWDGSSWVYSQQKDHRSEGPLFALYDLDGFRLDSSVYPNSSFKGDPIFGYAKGTGKVDDALGFAPVYVDYGNNPGYEFEFGLGAIRYTYNEVSTDVTYQTNSGAGRVIDIPGFYYFKNNMTGKRENGWSMVRGGQPVKRHIRHVVKDTTAMLAFELGTSNIYKEDTFTLSKEV